MVMWAEIDITRKNRLALLFTQWYRFDKAMLQAQARLPAYQVVDMDDRRSRENDENVLKRDYPVILYLAFRGVQEHDAATTGWRPWSAMDNLMNSKYSKDSSKTP